MFIEDKEFIEIKVFYKKVGRHYVAYSQDSFDSSEMSEEEKKEFQELNIQAAQLTWGLYNDLQEKAMVPDEFGNRKWNYKIYKENKLRSIIKKWDATHQNNEGKTVPVPLNPQMISKLAPDIAETILNFYDQKTLLDDEDEKKS